MLYQRIFEFLVFLAEGFIVFYYGQSLFERKRKNPTIVLLVVVLYISFFFVYLNVTGIINTIYILAINFVFLYFSFNCKIKNAVFHSIMLSVIMIITEFITALFSSIVLNVDVNYYENNSTLFIVSLIFSKMLYFIICLMLTRVFNRSKGAFGSASRFWALTIVPVATLCALTVLFNVALVTQVSNIFKIASSITAILMIIANIVLFFVYERSIKDAEKLFELKTVKQKLETDNKYYEILERQNNNLMVYAHDTKNHLQAIRNMTDDENIIEYLERLTADLNKYSRHASSGNHNLDVIINKYITECEIKGVSFDYDVRLSNLSGVQMFDLVSILGNLLDNALESAEKSAGKSIHLQTDHRNTYDVIVVTNSCDVKPVTQGDNLKSSKANKKQHGLGIKSIKSALENYSGDYNWEYNEENKEFVSTVMILRK